MKPSRIFFILFLLFLFRLPGKILLPGKYAFASTFFDYDYRVPAGKEGYWWYEVKKEKEKEEKKKQEVKAEKKTERKEKKNEEEWKPEKPLEAYTYKELLKMPVSKFRKLLNYYRDLAISNPTEKNVYYYYNLVDVARKKALLFMAQTMNVMYKYPSLYVGKDVPVIDPGIQAEFKQKKESDFAFLEELKKDFGLILFVKEGCPYCEVEKKIVSYLFSQGVPVKIVDVSVRPDVVERFAIQAVPTAILVYRKTGKYLPVAVGIVSLSELERNMATAASFLKGKKKEGQLFLYDFQKGSTLDPYTPPPLWRKEERKNLSTNQD